MTHSLSIKPYVQHLKVPYRWSKGTQHVRRGILVRAEWDGAVGWGEAALPPHVLFDGWAYAAHCAAMLDGLDAAQGDLLHELELREIPARLRCGVSSALLSAQAAHAGMSLARFLGGDASDVVPVNDLIGDADPQVCVGRAADAVKIGQDTVKIKCTTERELDIARVGAIREAFPDLRIRLDPNESWDVSWALEQIRAMEPFGIDYIEEPLPRGTDLTTYAELCRQTAVPIALDDSVRSLFHARRAIELRAAQVLILKPPRVGGPDRTKEIIDEAQRRKVRCVVTASLETSVGLHVALHCAALLPGTIEPCGLGTARFYKTDVADPPPIVAGAMTVPTAPGLGVDLQSWWDMN
ncbi:hypothetical protein GG851_19685 [Bordetella petrii]|nr:hypothetical protein [Bordetella petrii]